MGKGMIFDSGTSSILRVACLVDGFNLYHSIQDCIKETNAHESIKWINLKSLCESKLSIFNAPEASIQKFFYFSSLARHTSIESVSRHQAFIRALQFSGFEIIFGEFKRKSVRCKAACKQEYLAHVEKRTDVNIAIKLLELFQTDTSDACLILSGDGDLLSAVQTARKLFPKKKVGFLFPYRRIDRNLAGSAHTSSILQSNDYLQHRFPELVYNKEQSAYSKMPKSWSNHGYSSK